MQLIERAQRICLTPREEWKVIAGETTAASTLLKGYVVPLAAVGAVASFVGGSLVGRSLPFVGSYRVPVLSGILLAAFTVAMAVVSVLVLSAVTSALAPTFGGEKSSAQALKLAVYAYTPAWIAGVLQILPMLGALALVGALYGLYLLYLGIPTLMKCPAEKAVAYTAVVVVVAVVISMVLAGIGRAIVGGATALTGGDASAGNVQFDRDSALGKLQQLGKEMEESSRKIDAARASGDGKAEVAAAAEAFGTLLGGGKRVEPVAIEQLKPLVPETFAGLPKTSSSAGRTGVPGLAISTAKAAFGRDDRKVDLEISDSGGASGILALASWANVQGEREDDDGTERTETIDGRLVHERTSKHDSSCETSIVVARRFLVKASAVGLDVREMRAALSALDLGKLESMKDAGLGK